MRVAYTLHLLPIDRDSGDTISLTIGEDTTIVSERFVDNGVDPHVQVVTRSTVEYGPHPEGVRAQP